MIYPAATLFFYLVGFGVKKKRPPFSRPIALPSHHSWATARLRVVGAGFHASGFQNQALPIARLCQYLLFSLLTSPNFFFANMDNPILRDYRWLAPQRRLHFDTQEVRTPLIVLFVTNDGLRRYLAEINIGRSF